MVLAKAVAALAVDPHHSKRAGGIVQCVVKVTTSSWRDALRVAKVANPT